MHRIKAVILRYYFYLKHSYDRVTEVFFYPIIDIALWGMSTQYVRSKINDTGYQEMILVGLLLWILVWRSQHEIIISLLQEYWDGNLINLFISPLSLFEWLTGVLMISLFKVSLSFFSSYLVILYLYNFNLLFLVNKFLIAIPILILMGWSIGILMSSVLFLVGNKAQSLPFSFIALLSPFAAIFYPVSTLPEWAQKIAFLVPSAHVFEAVRNFLLQTTDTNFMLNIGLWLSIAYFFISLILFRFCFNFALKRGLKFS